MNRRMTSIVLASALLGLTAQLAWGDDDSSQLSVTVAFGAGLNTAQAANHHVLPKVINVKEGGVVHFVVAGFHQVFVYEPGKRAKDVVVPASGQFIDDMDQLFYQGLSPTGPPPEGFDNSQNRVESVLFPQEGTYLVICNVRSHFLDGMWALVRVH